MAHLPGEHADLTPVMGVMRKQVSEKARRVGFESRNPPVARERAAQDCIERAFTFRERVYCVLFRVIVAFKFRGKFRAFISAFDPHDSDIVHMSEHRGDVASLTARRFRAPSLVRHVFDQIGIDAIVSGPRSEKRVRDRKLGRMRVRHRKRV